MTPTHNDVLHLIELVYAAVDEPDNWDRFMADFQRVSGLSAAGLTVRRDTREDFRFTAGYGFEESHLLEFNEHVTLVNPYQAHAERQANGYTTRAGASLVPRREFTSSVMYDWMNRIGAEDIVLGLEKSERGGMASFNAMTPTGTLIEEHHVALVRCLVPHIFHALKLSQQLAKLEARAAVSQEALARADFGCVVLDHRGRVDWLNDYAQALLERADPLCLVDDELRAPDPAAQGALVAALGAALRLSAGQVEPVAPVLKLKRLGGGRPVELLVSPTRPFSHRLFGSARGAMLLIADPDHVGESFAESLVTLHGLTPAEAEVAQWLVSGASVSRIAEVFGNTEHTVRTHVKRMRSKCDAASIAELVGVLQRSLARLG